MTICYNNSVLQLRNKKGKRVLGIDHSTTTLAFCLSVDGVPEYWEEIPLLGSNVYARIGDLVNKLAARFDSEDINTLVIEKTVQVNSRDTVVKLAMIAGAIIGYFEARGIQAYEVSALTWQAATAKPTLTKAEQAALKLANPGRAKSWYSNEARKIRKQRIIDWVANTFGINVPSDCADSICIAYYGSSKL
jgi:hypothetical protein